MKLHDMAKVITKYRGFTAAIIKARATVPAQADMTVVGDTIECTKLNTSAIRNGSAGDNNSIGALNLGTTVNIWSGFGPTKRTFTNSGSWTGVLTNSTPIAPHEAGEFAGYNHNAPVPNANWAIYKAAAELDIWIIASDPAPFWCDVDFGEVNFNLGSGGNGVAVVMTIWNTGALIDYHIFDLATFTHEAQTLIHNLYGISTQTTYQVKLFITDSTSVFDTDSGSNILCLVPNSTEYTVTVKIKQLNSLQLVLLDFTGGSTYKNDSLGRVGWFGDMRSPSNYTNLVITGFLFDWTNTKIEEIVIYDSAIDGSYSAMDPLTDLYAQFITTGTTHGYTFILEFYTW